MIAFVREGEPVGTVVRRCVYVEGRPGGCGRGDRASLPEAWPGICDRGAEVAFLGAATDGSRDSMPLDEGQLIAFPGTAAHGRVRSSAACGALPDRLRLSEEEASRSEGVAKAYRRHIAAAMAALDGMDVESPLAARDRAVAELGRATDEQAAFLHAAAHDLRNPLTALRGQAQLLRRRARQAGVGGVEVDRVNRSVAAIEEAAERTALLIEHLLEGQWLVEDAVGYDTGDERT